MMKKRRNALFLGLIASIFLLLPTVALPVYATTVTKDFTINEPVSVDGVAKQISLKTSYDWETYTVIYNLGGGTGVVSDANNYTKGATATVVSEKPTPPNDKTFFEWNTEQNGGGTGYQAGATFSITADITLYAQYLTGNGVDIPIQLSTAAQLAAIANIGLDKNYTVMADITVPNWAPLGGDNGSYTGTFDGNGKTITINGISNNPNMAGLFGKIGTTGIVKNLAVKGTVVTTKNSAGAIAGENNGLVEQCYAGIISQSGTSNCNTGGIVGINNGTIKNCYATGTRQDTEGAAGGIVGWNSGAIENCYSTATVESPSAGGIAGGTYGYGTEIIRNCVALNDTITSIVSKGGYLGYDYGATLSNNYSYLQIAANGGKDGTACDAKPDQTWWTTATNWDTTTGSAWDFTNIWQMGTDGYPELRVFAAP